MQGTMLLDSRYEVGGLLGRGGMADVWDGWDHVSGQPVAVKMLHPQFADRADIVRRFYAEASAAAAIGHPNIVNVYASGDQDGTPFIVMERLSGGTLADELERGQLPQQRVRRILDEILAALTATHARGILHRDIKPGNLLTAGDGYKLADFGLAKTSNTAHTAVGEVFGTFAYLSPQRLTGAQASVDDDLFALGVIGYEALAGHHPFGPTEDLAAVTHAILLRDAPPLRFFAPDADPALIATIERAMTRDPRLRFASAAEMRAVLHGQPVRACPRPTLRPATKVYSRPPASPAYSAVPVAPRRKPTSTGTKVAAAVGVLAALAVTVFAFTFDGGSAVPAPKPISSVAPVAPPPSVAPVVPAAPEPTAKEHQEPAGHAGKGPKEDRGHGPRGPKGEG
jgi:serine/threonine protein kinase